MRRTFLFQIIATGLSRIQMARVMGIALGFVFFTGHISWAQTINILVATIQAGQVHVEGSQAPKKTAIFWEGVAVEKNTNAGGAFTFDVTNLPTDCVGLLTIGSASRDVVISSCTPPPITIIEAGVPRTGQTASFAVGDDGDLERGVPLPGPRFTDTLDGTITDNLTGLIWLRNANCGPNGPNWSQAFGLIATLNSSGSMNGTDCGDVSNSGSHQTDWRLPTVREFLSLMNWAYSNPAMSNAAGTAQAINGDPFLNLVLSSATNFGYWTSTSDADFPEGAALAVGFFFGGIVEGSKTEMRPVMAVRGGS